MAPSHDPHPHPHPHDHGQPHDPVHEPGDPHVHAYDLSQPHDAHHHDHAHGHSHGHGHHHLPPPNADGSVSRTFAIGAAINLIFVVVEATAGFVSGSMALLADAGHNLSDVLGLVLAWAAVAMARRRPTARRTYGMRKATILASLANAAVLLIVVGGMILESAQRLFHPEPIASSMVMAVAAIGVVLNGGTALLFMRGSHGDLNVRGAFLHLAADAGVSIGVVLAALAISATGWLWIDPVMGLAIAAVIIAGTWGLLRDSFDLAMDAAPRGIDPDAVRAWLAGRDGVKEVHDLHIWAMSTTETALTAHVVRDGANHDAFLAMACEGLEHDFRIGHVTLQVEGPGGGPCRLAPADVV
ncbi:MAG: cation efflux family protein [Caulobacteraceae bacterium]|nr:cation efflux family protein [Caulobacteraceae bacterium]